MPVVYLFYLIAAIMLFTGFFVWPYFIRPRSSLRQLLLVFFAPAFLLWLAIGYLFLRVHNPVVTFAGVGSVHLLVVSFPLVLAGAVLDEVCTKHSWRVLSRAGKTVAYAGLSLLIIGGIGIVAELCYGCFFQP